MSLVRQLLLCPTAPDLGEVTQLVPLDVTQVLQLHRRTNTIIPQVSGAAGPAAKRRRVSSHDEGPGGGRLSLDSLLQEVAGGGGEARVPWVQIVTELLKQHPDSLAPGQGEGVLRLLASLLQSSRSSLLRRHLLAACDSLASCLQPSPGGDWAVVARQASNMLSINQAGEQGHRLLQTLLTRGGGVLPAAQVYSLYTSRLVRQDELSLATLAFLLKRHPVREGGQGREVRRELLVWLLPGEEGEGRGGGRSLWGEEGLGEVLEGLVTRRMQVPTVTCREEVEEGSLALLERQLLELALLRNIGRKELGQEKGEEEGGEKTPEPLLLPDLAGTVVASLIQVR